VNIAMLLEMAAMNFPGRVAIGRRDDGLTYSELARRVTVGAAAIVEAGVERVVFLAGNGELFPTTVFACGVAGVPVVPLNYRLGPVQLAALLADQKDVLVICEARYSEIVAAHVDSFLTTDEWAERLKDSRRQDDRGQAPDRDNSGDGIAVLLYTSGTSAAPKAAVLRHRHLVSYILNSVEFDSAANTDASLVSVPPYHIAGVATILSNVYAGRRLVYLDRFMPEQWLQLAVEEGVSNAMVVPTMLARIVDYLEANPDAARPKLRSLAYGGARMPLPVIEAALRLFPGTDFVNAYGLTETSSTIAVLDPGDHRAAVGSDDPAVRARLSSAGKPVAGLEVQVRSPEGQPLLPGQPGELWVRGPQVSGEYLGTAMTTDEDGWFPTRDRASLDAGGYLFVEGRADDTIIRGGENIAPGEVEDVILGHPDISECAVVGLPDAEWGQRLAAAVVLVPDRTFDAEALRSWLTARLRRSKTPDRIEQWDELPYTDTGKLIRRQVLDTMIERTNNPTPA
jgi:acyl-CoA synthetase (AMP-forming)/AMP-acid ligase II